MKDGAVVAIPDWELAGFNPKYWEYVKAYIFADWQSRWVADIIPDQIIQPKRTELAFTLHARDIMWLQLYIAEKRIGDRCYHVRSRSSSRLHLHPEVSI